MVTPTTGVGETIGVEEEFHVVDAETGEPSPAARRLLRRLGEAAEHELRRTMVETATDVHSGLEELRRDLVAKRRILAHEAGRLGLAVVTVGTVPAAGADRSVVYPNQRYEWMAEEYRQLVYEQQVCACQVQVGVADRDLAVRITRRIRSWLPVLLAMSVSSPYFRREDTGYGSYRTVVTSRWPTVGPSPDFDSAEDYDRTVAALVQSGVISDAGMVYFDARLSARYPTVEIRVADACPSVDDAVLLAALARALVVVAAEEDAEEVALPQSPQVLLRAATWRAARSGLDGHLVDPLTSRSVPARERLDALLTHVRPVLEHRGEWETVRELLERVVGRGTSAKRQRAAVVAGADQARLVGQLAKETATG